MAYYTTTIYYDYEIDLGEVGVHIINIEMPVEIPFSDVYDEIDVGDFMDHVSGSSYEFLCDYIDDDDVLARAAEILDMEKTDGNH